MKKTERAVYEEHLRIDHGLKHWKGFGPDIKSAHRSDHPGSDVRQTAEYADRPHNHPTGYLSPIQTTEVTYE